MSKEYEKPYRLRELIARYGQVLGQKMYDREQVAEELNLAKRIEEIEESSENLEWRKQQIEELKQMLMTEMEEFEELLQLLGKIKEDPDVNTLAILFERDPVNKDMWHAKYAYQSFCSRVKDMLAGKRIIRFTYVDGSTELLEVNMYPDDKYPDDKKGKEKKPE